MKYKSVYVTINNINQNVLRGGVEIPTGGESPRPVLTADPVRFRNRQYSLDERRSCADVGNAGVLL